MRRFSNLSPLFNLLIVLMVSMLISGCNVQGGVGAAPAAPLPPSNTPPSLPTRPPLTATNTYTPTMTFTPTTTGTPTPTRTPTITLTPTNTYTPSITPTASQTYTPSPTDTATPSNTPRPLGDYVPPRRGELATLEDFWMGYAKWVLDLPYTRLPVGESDTLYMGDGVYFSYLHASYGTAGILDSCGSEVQFPGCITRWISEDEGRNFYPSSFFCMLECDSCPCDWNDHTSQQQYPRVFRMDDGHIYLVYEHGAAAWLTDSWDGINWTTPRLIHGTGMWPSSLHPCTEDQKVNPHPFWSSPLDCMVGGPPGIYITDYRMYIFVGLGQNPGHMGCLWAPLDNLNNFRLCSANPIFDGELTYGPLDASGADANPYYDFRFVTSADVVYVNDYYYMTYEGIRGPTGPDAGRDNQFSLGFARSRRLDGKWEKYEGNPVFEGVYDNWGLGHADLVIVDGVTYMYTATPLMTRGRYILVVDEKALQSSD